MSRPQNIESTDMVRAETKFTGMLLNVLILLNERVFKFKFLSPKKLHVTYPTIPIQLTLHGKDFWKLKFDD